MSTFPISIPTAPYLTPFFRLRSSTAFCALRFLCRCYCFFLLFGVGYKDDRERDIGFLILSFYCLFPLPGGEEVSAWYGVEVSGW